MTIEQLKELRDRESALRSYLAIDERLEKIANDKALSVSDGFWDDNKRATAIIKEINKIEISYYLCTCVFACAFYHHGGYEATHLFFGEFCEAFESCGGARNVCFA